MDISNEKIEIPQNEESVSVVHPPLPKLFIGFVGCHEDEFTMYRQMLASSKYDTTFEVILFQNLSDYESFNEEKPNLLLFDLCQKENSSFEEFRSFHKRNPLVPIIALTEFQYEDLGLKAIRAGAEDYLIKEVINPYQLHRSIICSIERNQLERTLWDSNKAMKDFAGIAAHDLKSPISTILSYIELLRDFEKFEAEELRTMISRIGNSGARMVRLIEALLKYAEVDNRMVSIVNVDLAKVMGDIAQDINAKNMISFKNLPAIEGDEAQLYQLFKNLIENALKFIPKDQSPEIEVYAKPVEGMPGFVDVMVRDNGIGIAPENKAKIFDAFTRLSNKYDGSGIGLATCKRIVTNHKGKISVRSKFGEGSTFILTLPTKQIGL